MSRLSVVGLTWERPVCRERSSRNTKDTKTTKTITKFIPLIDLAKGRLNDVGLTWERPRFDSGLFETRGTRGSTGRFHGGHRMIDLAMGRLHEVRLTWERLRYFNCVFLKHEGHKDRPSQRPRSHQILAPRKNCRSPVVAPISRSASIALRPFGQPSWSSALQSIATSATEPDFCERMI
jgi:hypothetical protein